MKTWICDVENERVGPVLNAANSLAHEGFEGFVGNSYFPGPPSPRNQRMVGIWKISAILPAYACAENCGRNICRRYTPETCPCEDWAYQP